MKKNVLFLFWALLPIYGCSFYPDKVYERVKEEVECVRVFHELFPHSKSKISGFSGIGAPNSWVSKDVVYGRYFVFITFEFPRDFEYENDELECVVHVCELGIDKRYAAAGNSHGHYREFIGSIKKDVFMQMGTVDELLDAAKVDPIIKDQPIPSYELFVDSWDYF